MLKDFVGDSRFQEPISDLDHVFERHGNPDKVPGLTSTVWGPGQKTEGRQTALGATAEHSMGVDK